MGWEISMSNVMIYGDDYDYGYGWEYMEGILSGRFYMAFIWSWVFDD